MEDRRIRMNFWVSKMLKKPIEQFPNPKLINFNGEEKQLREMKNPKSKDFTILRSNPIVVINKDRNAIQKTVLQHPILQKEKLTPHEISVKVEKLSQRNIGRCCCRSSDRNIKALSVKLAESAFSFSSFRWWCMMRIVSLGTE